MTLIGGVTAENLRTFAILYVLGNIIALIATGFLLGPASQCKKMWAETRRYSTAFYLIMLIVVFAVAITVSPPPSCQASRVSNLTLLLLS